MKKKVCDRCEAENSANANYCAGCGYRLPEDVEEKKEETSVKTTKNNLQKQIFSIIGLLIGFLLIWGVQRFVFSSPGIDKQIVLIADEMNRTCPFMVDSVTRLDNVSALPSKTLQYNYSVSFDKNEIDTLLFKEYMEPVLINNLKTNPQAKYMRENKIKLNYLYKDRNGQYICLISISSDLYN